ncbi:kinase-like protein [Basidiobolus meristosporus CBS 931.73]|uniref:Kinase-like protein n=1 Tax=Basidiobolus meristosporus CBS 931.73 TaxID=1314790 RepID=A0A1Y1WB77_9FUNG|nr:kinase-like protein [Basidiobolus meristosporus CBS 931.73]|eukprot:ORX70414.1 kinase-like protein [Basidiobolus meristosporus CBS 931.73]
MLSHLHLYHEAPNKGIHIPYHSQESLASQYSTGLCDSSTHLDTSTTTPSDDCFTAGMSSLYKVPSRFVFRDSKKDRKSTQQKKFGFFSLRKKHLKSQHESKARSNDYMPLLDALRKRNAPSINQLYGDYTNDICSGAGGGVRQTYCPRTGRKYAVKSFRAKRPDEDEHRYYEWVSNEVYITASLVHENVIQTLDVIMENNEIHEVMEYCPQDMFTVVKENQLTQQEIDIYFSQLMRGLAYLHHRGVAHRDLKLENLCVDENGTLKIIDFGCAFIFLDPLSEGNRAKASELTGSDPYIAPEVFDGRPYDAAKADIWSAGIIYLCMVLRKFPWDMAKPSVKNYEMYLEFRKNGESFTRIPEAAFPLIRKMLDPNPDTRITVDEIFQDRWFQSIMI